MKPKSMFLCLLVMVVAVPAILAQDIVPGKLEELNLQEQKLDTGILANLKKLHPERFGELNMPLIEAFEKETVDNWQTFRVNYQICDRGYEVVVQVRNVGGELINEDGNIHVSQADGVEILAEVIPIEPYAKTQVNAQKHRMGQVGSYEEMRAKHALVHGEMFNRVSLHLDKTGFQDGSNEWLFERQKKSETINPYLVEKIFNMGLYGLISSSGENPPNLMGIWNGDWRPKWSGDFTLDANVNLQISASLAAMSNRSVLRGPASVRTMRTPQPGVTTLTRNS